MPSPRRLFRCALLLALGLAMPRAARAACDPTTLHFTWTEHPTRGSTRHLRVADFDGDGVPDLVYTSVGDTNGFVVERGLGGGALASPRLYPIDGVPTGFALVDYDHDGITDAFVADTASAYVHVMHGGPGGALTQASLAYVASAGATDILSSDFNADGIPDLVVCIPEGQVLFAARGLGAGGIGNGAFGGPYAYTPGLSGALPTQLFAAHMPGDTLTDVVAASRGTVQVHFFAAGGGGPGPLSSPIQDLEFPGRGAAAFGYATVLGRQTLAVGLTGPAGLFLNHGSFFPGPSPTNEAVLSDDPRGVFLSDADGDGLPDCVVAADSVLEFVRDRTFGDASLGVSHQVAREPIPGHPAGLVGGDLDGDGGAELLLLEPAQDRVEIGHASCSPPSDPPPPTQRVGTWPDGGFAVCTADGDQSHPCLLPDHAGGAFVAWEDRRGGLDADIYVSHALGDAQVAPGWPATGSLALGGPADELEPQLVEDRAGGVYVFALRWSGASRRVVWQHVLADGSLDPALPSGAQVLTPTAYQSTYRALPDGDGGFVVVRTDTSNGTTEKRLALSQPRLPGRSMYGWPQGDYGIDQLDSVRVAAAISPAPGDLVVAERWAGSIDTNTLHEKPPMQAIRELADNAQRRGVVDQFPESAPSLAADPYGGWLELERGFSASDHASHPSLRRQTPFATVWQCVLTGVPAGRALAIAGDGRNGGYLAYTADDGTKRLARVSAAGVPSPNFPADGVDLLPAAASLVGLEADGIGGVFAAWSSRESLLVTERDSMRAASLPAFLSAAFDSIGGAALAADEFGGYLAAWTDARGSSRDIYLQRGGRAATTPALFAPGTARWADGAVRLGWFVATGQPRLFELHRGDAGGGSDTLLAAVTSGSALLEFTDRTVVPGATYAYRLVAPASAGRPEATSDIVAFVVPTLELALAGTVPSPARAGANIRFALPDARPATLRLYDVAGRRVWDRRVESAGPGWHALPIERALAPAPGVYWLELRHGTARITKRMVWLD